MADYLTQVPPIQDSAGLAELVQTRIAAGAKRTFKLSWEGREFWAKRSIPAEKTHWHRLAAIVAKLTDNPIYMPTVSEGGDQALADEARRLRALLGKGVAVPPVVAEGCGWFVMADLGGRTLKDVLTDPQLSDSLKEQALCRTASELAQIHRRGCWHGRPALRDLLWTEQGPVFVDFEEDLAAVLSPLEAMQRDLFVFVHGLYRYLPENHPWIDACLGAYLTQAPEAVWQGVGQIARSMNWVYRLCGWLAPWAGHDVRQMYLALQRLRPL